MSFYFIPEAHFHKQDITQASTQINVKNENIQQALTLTIEPSAPNQNSFYFSKQNYTFHIVESQMKFKNMYIANDGVTVEQIK